VDCDSCQWPYPTFLYKLIFCHTCPFASPKPLTDGLMTDDLALSRLMSRDWTASRMPVGPRAFIVFRICVRVNIGP